MEGGGGGTNGQGTQRDHGEMQHNIGESEARKGKGNGEWYIVSGVW